MPLALNIFVNGAAITNFIEIYIFILVKTLENENCFSFNFNLQKSSCLLSYLIDAG